MNKFDIINEQKIDKAIQLCTYINNGIIPTINDFCVFFTMHMFTCFEAAKDVFTEEENECVNEIFNRINNFDYG